LIAQLPDVTERVARGFAWKRGPENTDATEVHERMWALARVYLESLASRGEMVERAELAADIANVDGAREVWWWLTGRDTPAPRVPVEARVHALFAEATHRALGPLGWLAPETLASRLDAISGWVRLADEHERKSRDCAEHLFLDRMRDRTGWLDEAVAARRASFGGDAKAYELARDGLLARLESSPMGESGPLDLADWCTQAAAIGIALGSEPRLVEGPGRRIVQRLVHTLPALVANAPIPLHSPVVELRIWQHAPSLIALRDRQGGREDVRTLLAALAESGAYSPGAAKRIARLLRGLTDREAALAFAVRLSWTSLRRRDLLRGSWGSKSGLAALVKADCGDDVGRALRELFDPESAPCAEALAHRSESLTRMLAGRELEPHDAPEMFWSRSAQAALLSVPEDGGRKRAGSLVLAAALGLRVLRERTARSLLLVIDETRGRHGERYVGGLLVGVDRGAIRVAARGGAYGVLLDESEGLRHLADGFAALRDRARIGQAARADIKPLRDELARMPSDAFWTAATPALLQAGASLELDVFDDGLPWELAPLRRPGDTATTPLGVALRVFRRRGAPFDAPRAIHRPRCISVVHDPSHPGAKEECDFLAELAARAGILVRRASSLESVRDAARDGAVNTLHFAGHQGPAHDTAPSLALSGAPLSLEDVASCFPRAPELVFLNACSTLAPSRETSEGTTLGGLDAARASPFPCVLGTLYDIAPPDDAFVRTFYEALFSGAGVISSLHAARIATAARAPWAAWWPAYVMLSSPLAMEASGGSA
jgi:hypothetical protein